MIKTFYEFITTSVSNNRKNVMIFGAGGMGLAVKRIVQSEINSGFRIKGFIDDNRKLQGKTVNGYKVYSQKTLTSGFVEKGKIKVIILAISDLHPSRKEEIVKLALDLDLDILETPPVDNWLHGQLTLRQLHKVKLEDLLGREPIQLNMQMIEKGLKGKTILVTGAAGSIGSEIVRQLTRFSTGRIVLVDQAETPVFYLMNELKLKYSASSVSIIIADITNRQKMENIFRKYRPEIVFHAAAYKHVPVMEGQPHEAFRVNVGGTVIVTKLSVKYGVEKFVMISTDKAVNPTNVMGASKRICELYMQAMAYIKDIKTQFVTTRFGNVLGSNGSVIELFTQEIEKGGPVTITHPDMTRFFMTTSEACQLVLEAGFMGNGGEIYVFDMGKQIKIVDLANHMIKLSGFVPGKEIQIMFTGLRPGEKLHEELLSDKEVSRPTHNPKITIAVNKMINYGELLPKIEETLDSLYKKTDQEVVSAMKEMVPEYVSSNGDYQEETRSFAVVNGKRNLRKET
jgi:FlaA1/EpsC-like NDP-sugar epimerase